MKRPESEVSSATGLIGALSLMTWIVVASVAELSLLTATTLFLFGTATPMVIWGLIVEKVHLRESTGLDFSMRRPAGQVLSLTRTKFIGLGATFLLIGLTYFFLKTYSDPRYTPYFAIIAITMPLLLLASLLYISFVNRHMVEPEDGLWHFGKLVCLKFDEIDAKKIKDHLQGWAIKGFFLAFMASIFPGLVAGVLNFNLSSAMTHPVEVILFLIRLMFLFDVCFGTIGYVLTMRPLDSHIRSANPYFSGWVVALICYPPFTMMGSSGPLDYRSGTQEWTSWFSGLDMALLLWGFAILSLTFIYVWSTVIFGIRFSNLTHRGIITNGPYRFFRHPAYLSKNVMWWLIHLPFLSTESSVNAVQNCVLLLAVNGIYYARAKTEERHLMTDPKYRDYSEWISKNGILERLLFRLCGQRSLKKIGGSLK